MDCHFHWYLCVWYLLTIQMTYSDCLGIFRWLRTKISYQIVKSLIMFMNKISGFSVSAPYKYPTVCITWVQTMSNSQFWEYFTAYPCSMFLWSDTAHRLFICSHFIIGSDDIIYEYAIVCSVCSYYSWSLMGTLYMFWF